MVNQMTRWQDNHTVLPQYIPGMTGLHLTFGRFLDYPMAQNGKADVKGPITLSS
jgi:hypothetical protein